MIILDTNVLSELMHRVPDRNVMEWLDRQPRTDIWTTSVTILEIRFGLQILPLGRRRTLMVEAFEKVLDRVGKRISPFDVAAANRVADLLALQQKAGRTVEFRDAMIAGIVLVCSASLATRNIRHFQDLGIPIINPWEN